MTLVRKLKRTLRRRMRKTAVRTQPRTRRTSVKKESPKAQRRAMQTLFCGILFVTLIALKLLLPGNLASFRATLGEWLVRDADFVSAFHAIGEAVGGTKAVSDSLGEAYTAVFGDTENAVEVLGAEESVLAEDDLQDTAEMEQRILGFSYVTPLAGTLTSEFGLREDPNTSKEAMHYGVDIAAEEGSGIAAFADGVVSVVGESAALGKYLTVQHENGYETLYAHCSAVTVSSGASVKAGDTIAKVGHTGNATGSHLHFELQCDDTFLNPIYYLDL